MNKLNMSINFDHLNEDVYRHILTFLPIHDLKSMRLLSKKFNIYTTDPLLKRSEVKIDDMAKLLHILASDISVKNIRFKDDLKLDDLMNDQKIEEKLFNWINNHGYAIKSLTFENVIWGTLVLGSYYANVDRQYGSRDYTFWNTILTKLSSLKSINIEGAIHLYRSCPNIASFDISALTQMTSVERIILDIHTFDAGYRRSYETDLKEAAVCVQQLAHGIVTMFASAKSWTFKYRLISQDPDWRNRTFDFDSVIVTQQILSLMVSSPEMFPALTSLNFSTLNCEYGRRVLQSLEKMKQFSPGLVGQIEELKIAMRWDYITRMRWPKDIIKVLEEVFECCRATLQTFTMEFVNDSNDKNCPPPTFTLNVPTMKRMNRFRIAYIFNEEDQIGLTINDIPRNTVIRLSRNSIDVV